MPLISTSLKAGTNEDARFIITIGSDSGNVRVWLDLTSDPAVGSVTGDIDLPPGIGRIRWDHPRNWMILNRATGDTDSLIGYIQGNQDKSIFVLADRDLDSMHQIHINTFNQAGGVNWTRVESSVSSINTAFDAIEEGDEVLFVFADANTVTLSTAPDKVDPPVLTAGDTEIEVSWVVPDDGGSPITDYDLQHSTDQSTWTEIDLGNVTSHTITGLTNGTTYYVQVRANNGIGEGDWSDALSATPMLPATAPAQVSTPTASAGVEEIDVSWTAPDDGGSPITDYDLRHSTDQSTWTVVDLGNVTSHTLSNLTAGTTYYVQVRASNSVGDGNWSSSASATPMAAATVPAQVSTPSLSAGNTEIDATWTAPSNGGSTITGYDVRISTDQTNWTETDVGNVRSHTFSSLTNGTTYYVQVRARNAQGDGAWSSSVSATPEAPPPTPTVPNTNISSLGDPAIWAFIYEVNADGYEGDCLGYIQLLNLDINYSVNTISQIDIEVPVNPLHRSRRLRTGLILHIYTDYPRYRLLTICFLQQRNRKLTVSEYKESWRCVDYFQELKNSSIGVDFKIDGLPFRGALDVILNAHPEWTYSGATSELNISMHLNEESVFTALLEVAEQAGLNFKLAIGKRHIIFLERDKETDHVLKQNNPHHPSATDKTFITSISHNVDSAELFNRIIPYSAQPSAPLTLEKSTLDTPYSIEQTTLGSGEITYSLADHASIQQYGEITRVLKPSYLIYPSSAEDDQLGLNAANALYRWAAETLKQNSEPQTTYEIQVLNFQDAYTYLGQRVRLQYIGYLENEEWVDIDEFFSVTDVEQSFNTNEHLSNITLTNNNIRPRRPEDLLADLYKAESRSITTITLTSSNYTEDFEHINELQYDDEGELIEGEVEPEPGEYIIREMTFSVPENFIEIIRADLTVSREDTRTGPSHVQLIMDGAHLDVPPLLYIERSSTQTIDLYEYASHLFTRAEHILGIAAVYGTGRLEVQINIVGTILQ